MSEAVSESERLFGQIPVHLHAGAVGRIPSLLCWNLLKKKEPHHHRVSVNPRRPGASAQVHTRTHS